MVQVAWLGRRYNGKISEIFEGLPREQGQQENRRDRHGEAALGHLLGHASRGHYLVRAQPAEDRTSNKLKNPPVPGRSAEAKGKDQEHGLGWFLASRPHFAERVYEELRNTIGNRLPGFTDLPRLIFLEQMVNETLRHRPPAIGVFGRQAVEEVGIGGYRLPKGAIAHALSYLVHHDERWFPQPNEFDPERFSPERSHQIHPHAYFPFGIGPRTCIGNHFAKMEMMLVVATLLQRFSISPAAGQCEPQPVSDVTLRPKGGLQIKLRTR